MKIITKLIIFSVFITTNLSYAQTLNWANLQKEQRHIASLAIGLDYSLTLSVGYGYQLKTNFPIVVGAEYAMPSGKNLGDDFKTKVGGQVRWFRVGDFRFSTKVQGIFRRYENNYVRLNNFGADFSGVIGYYKPKWFLAGEVGFDKAIVTHFKHTEAMKENFAAKDGWYNPATGGNFYYGLQSGFSWRSHDLILKAGKIITQDFRTTPLLPFYAQIGYNLKIK
ncbi:hypothetical protein [Emticicia agri]|uniref:Outer membrane protein beta-barrel domain-containing protein n=1 Tax=Emticicia agri TaxID=2492393 RepID=A0A4Q5LV43_9BACT|nr:hypothetical protein [Emticicia agri]RYU93558.1 hypothetical protein EWM59_21505 [Emticicia agri]